LSSASCGYHLVGTSPGLAARAGNIAIPVFVNNSSEPGIERNVTAKVKESFIRDGRLKVVNMQDADLIFTGHIKHYEIRPVSFDNNNNALEYWVIMNIDVKLQDSDSKENLIDREFRSKWDYKVTSEVLSSERARINAIDEASRDFAERMVSIVIEGF
jgi:hypothetical protein